jgi:alcohol dehydrogenase
MNQNIFTSVWPGQVHFGFGAVGLVAEELKAMHARHVFIVADPGVIAAGLIESVVAPLEAADLPYTVYDKVIPNPDTQSVDAAVEAFRESQADVIVGMGGGSGLDTAKAVRLVAGGPAEGCVAEYSPFLEEDKRPTPFAKDMPPIVAIPTTAGTGSEATPWALITDKAAKLKFGVGSGYATEPTIALVDPELTLSVPSFLTAATGMDALSHCIEAYVSTHDNPILDPIILYGIELLGRGLRMAVAHGTHRTARHDVMLGSLIGGLGITSKWLGACHALSHPLSAIADVQHGVANALMLPHQMVHGLSGALNRYARIGEALNATYPLTGTIRHKAQRAVETVRELVVDTGLPIHLRDVGVTREMIPELSTGAYEDQNWLTNPKSINQADLEQLYLKAF